MAKHQPRSKSAAKKRARPGKAGRRRSADIGQRTAASEQAPIRAAGGRFVPGVSGNPGGRPKENDEVKQLARQHTEAAITRLVQWMQDDNPKASVAACIALLDRGWGRPTQAISGEGGGPIDVNLVEVRSGIASKLNRIASAGAKASVSR
jgi:hypothetical protein